MRHVTWIAGLAALLLATLIAWTYFASPTQDTASPTTRPLDPVPDVAATESRSPVPAASEARSPASEPGLPEVDPSERPTVAFGSLSVQVLLDDGTPLPDTGLIVESASSWGSFRGVSDRTGLARFEGVSLGRYAVRGDCGGLVVVRVGPGDQFVELKIPRGRDLVVRVLDESGAAIAGASVFLSVATDSRESTRMGTTDVLGELALRRVEAGRFVSVRMRGFEPSPSVPVLDEHRQHDSVMVLQLAPGGASLRGRVVTSPDREPIEGASIRISGGSREFPAEGTRGFVVLGLPPLPREIVSDREGRFHADDLNSGALEVRVTASGFLGTTQFVDVRPGESASVEFGLLRGAPIRGRVVDQDGAGVSEAIVSASNSVPVGTNFAVTGADGGFELQGLPLGEHVLLARASRGRSARVRVEVPYEGPNLQFVLEGPERPACRVLDPTGAPIGGCCVTLGASAPGPGPSPRSAPLGRTDRDGCLWIGQDEDRDGFLYFWLASPSAPFPSGHVERKRGSEVTFVCSYTRERAAAVIVPCEVTQEYDRRLVVRLIDVATQFEALALPDAKGSVEFRELPPGRYALEFSSGPDDVRRGPSITLQASETLELAPVTWDDYHRLSRAR
jgi:hypothetical protein